MDQRARPAVERLVRHPAAAVALRTAWFSLPPKPGPADVAALVRDLDAEAFAVREAAWRKLAVVGEAAWPRRCSPGWPPRGNCQ
jgi:hypothetical protein